MAEIDSNIDIHCIFPGYIGCPGCHCEECDTFHREKYPVPLQALYRLWHRYLKVNKELPPGTPNIPSRSRAQIEKDLSGAVHRKKMTKSEAMKLNWAKGVYDNKVANQRKGKNGLPQNPESV